MKLLKRQVLFVLADGVAFLQPNHLLEYMTYKQLYWRLKDYKQVSVRGAVSELIVNGFLDKITRGGGAKFRLTKIGIEQLGLFFRQPKYGNKKWDSLWRMVIFERGAMSLSEQRQLKRILGELGFTRLEKGIYVSPFAITKDLTKQLMETKLTNAVKVLETKRFIVGDDKVFAREMWGLSTIYNKYKTLINQLERLLYRVSRAKGLTDRLKADFSETLFLWRSLMSEDPGLPSQLIPSEWPHLEARKLVHKLTKSIRALEVQTNID